MNEHKQKKGYYDDVIAWCEQHCVETRVVQYANAWDECVSSFGNILSDNGTCDGCPYAAWLMSFK